MVKRLKNYIGGQFVEAEATSYLPVINPATCEVLAEVPDSSRADVDRAVKAADILRAAQSVDRKLITNVSVFDVYEGKGIDPGKKSVAIAVTLQPRDKTMTDQEIEAVAAKIVAEVGKRTGGTLRA